MQKVSKYLEIGMLVYNDDIQWVDSVSKALVKTFAKFR